MTATPLITSPELKKEVYAMLAQVRCPVGASITVERVKTLRLKYAYGFRQARAIVKEFEASNWEGAAEPLFEIMRFAVYTPPPPGVGTEDSRVPAIFVFNGRTFTSERPVSASAALGINDTIETLGRFFP